MKPLYAATLFVAALLTASPGQAADVRELAAGLKAAAFDEKRPLPAGLDELSYDEALALKDRLSQSHIRQLLQQHQRARRSLPGNLLSALRFASPSHGGRVER